MEHTREPAPGPYRVDQVKTYYGNPQTVHLVVKDADGISLCSLAHDGLPLRCEVGGRNVVRSVEQVEGTAALFAASWRLLQESRRVAALLRESNPFLPPELLAAAEALGAVVADADRPPVRRAA